LVLPDIKVQEEVELKKQVLFSLIILVVLVGTILSACTGTAPGATPGTTPAAPAAKDKIVVGMSRPLSGWNAQIGDSAFRPVYETWVKEVNAAGGINVGGKKLPIELKIYDDKSDMGTATKLTEKLILEDKVDFLWPASGTSFLFAQAPIANKYNYILSTAEGGATSLKEMLPSLPYVFVNLSFSDWYEIPVLAEVLAEKGAKTAYIVYIADLHGIEYSGVAGIELPKKGINIVGVKSVPPDIKDLSPILKEAKAANVDAFLCFGYPDQNILATAQSMELGFNPKFFLTGPAANFGFYHDIFGPAVEGVSCWAVANRETSPAMKAMFDKLYAGKPEALNDWWGHPLYWAGLEFWKQAVEKAGTLDQKVIRDIMAKETFNTVLGPTHYENGLMAKESHTGEMGQWQNGKVEIIGYKGVEKVLKNYRATKELVYPKPAWPAPAKK
jgi:branched-chain amino acid transport system substrate-binding protein